MSRLLAIAGERWCYRPHRVRTFAAVSRGVEAELARYYPGIDIRVTPNGVDLERFRPDPSARAAVRAEARLAQQPVAIFVGGDWDRKGLGVAMQALARARGDGIDLRLWVVGEGDRRRFSNLATELHVLSAVSFLGPRMDVEHLLAGADMFVLPSLYETFSLVGFEAAAVGVPVVVTRVHGIGDLVREHGGGVLVDRTAVSVSDALMQLVYDSRLRDRLAKEARRGAMRYSWRASAEAMIEVYHSLSPQQGRA